MTTESRPPAAPGGQRAIAPVLGVCLFASGAAGLIYEVIWLRELSLVMGHTVYALSAVLTAFLGGLALGALLAGRWLERRGTSLGLYASVELAIAGCALLVPYATQALSPIFGSVYRTLGDRFVAYNLVQFALCGLVVLVPAVLMGATLPIVCDLLARDERDIGIGAGRLYALNSIGGALGATLAGFVLLPALGARATGFATAGLNAGVAALAFWLARHARIDDTRREIPVSFAPQPQPQPQPSAATAGSWGAPPGAMLVILYGLFGFASLALEVGWARIVSLSIGSTTHGFAIILATFISGLALGSFVAPRLRVCSRDPVRAIVALHALVALWTLASLAYLGGLPGRIAALQAGTGGPQTSVLVAQGGLVLATIAVPTVAMGGIFPLIALLTRRTVRSSGRAVGLSYGANTIGNIVGSFVAGFVLVPALGMRATIVCAALLSGIVGMGYLGPALAATRRGAVASALVLAAGLAWLGWRAPAWDSQRITSGPYFYPQDLGTLVDYREGASAVVAVKRIGNLLIMQVGGIREASTSSSLPNFLGHLAMLLHGPARDVLVVGLGSGSTLASVLRHSVERVECVEISPEVRDVARAHFAPFLSDPLGDARVRLIIGDGRNHLRHAERRYDVIVSQPSYPWVSGAASLFTREYFADVRAHLTARGIAASWFTAESGDRKRAIVRAWVDVFPAAYLFESKGAESVLVGMPEMVPLSAATVVAGMERPGVREDLARLKIMEPAALLGALVVGSDALRDYAAGVPSNTDDNGYVEFRGLLDLDHRRAAQETAASGIERQDPTPFVDVTLTSPAATSAFAERLRAVYAAKRATSDE